MTPRPALLLLFLSLGLLGCSGSRYVTVRVPPEVETRTAASVWSNSSWATKQLGGVHVSSDGGIAGTVRTSNPREEMVPDLVREVLTGLRESTVRRRVE